MEPKKINQNEHDIKAAIRFLWNLYEEIQLAQSLDDIKDPQILKKFKEYIEILEKIT